MPAWWCATSHPTPCTLNLAEELRLQPRLPLIDSPPARSQEAAGAPPTTQQQQLLHPWRGIEFPFLTRLSKPPFPLSPKIGPQLHLLGYLNFYPLVKTTSAVSPTSSARVPKNFPPGVKTTGEGPWFAQVSPSQFEGHAIRAARSKQNMDVLRRVACGVGCSKMVVPVILFRVMGSEAGGLPLVAMSRDNQGL
ncbi:hypothetical protein ZWY2020_028773, partial [Hordeum vulgare]